MRDDNGAGDKQAEADIVGTVGCSAGEWLEYRGLSVGRNWLSVVVNGEPHAFPRIREDDRHWGVGAVLNGIDHHVGHHLSQTVAIPHTCHVPA